MLRTAFGINDAGRIVGTADDPNNAAVNRGYYLDAGGQAQDIPSFAGTNGEIPFDVNASGAITGSAMMNQGSGKPFYFTQAAGMVEIPLASGGSGSGDGMNDNGWVVGRDFDLTVNGDPTGSGFLWDGTQTYVLNDLIGAQASQWNLQAPFAISNDGIIVGQGFFGGGQDDARAFALIPVPEPSTGALLLIGVMIGTTRRSLKHKLATEPHAKCGLRREIFER